MNEDIIRMARKADPDWDYDRDMVEWLERFAAIVIANNPPQTFMSYQEGYAAGVAAEREACAKVCDNIAARHEQQDSNISAGAAKDCAEIIRARGQV